MGRDAGELLGREPLGITATDSTDEIVALEADCVCYTPLVYDLDLLVALLRSGKNVVTTAGLIYPQALGPRVYDRLTEGCIAGRSSFHGTGLNPGWIAEVIPLISTGMCRSIRRIHSLEVCDVSDYGSKEMFLDFMKYGRPPEDFEVTARRYIENPELVMPGLAIGGKLGTIGMLVKTMLTRVPDMDRWERERGYPVPAQGDLAHDSEEWLRDARRSRPALIDSAPRLAKEKTA